MEARRSNALGFVVGRWPLDTSKPTLLFIHGAANNHLFWKHQVPALTDIANTVAMDLPDHGASKGPGKDNIADYAQIVMAFIKKLGLTQPVPCGLSMGGAVTLQLLIDHGDSFPAGILINTGAKLRVNPFIFETIQKDFSKFVASITAFGISPKSDADRLQSDIQDMMVSDPEVALNDFKACDKFNVMDRLGFIRSKVLVMTATDDNLTPVKYGDFMGQRIANTTVVNIEDAGHLSPLEKPDEVNDAIREFIKNQFLP